MDKEPVVVMPTEPEASENGGLAEKGKRLNIVLFIIAGILVAVFVVLLVVLVILKPAEQKTPDDVNIDPTTGEQLKEEMPEDYERGEPINLESIDFSTVGGETAYIYITRLLKSSDNNIYKGAVSGGNIDASLVISNIDNIVSQNNITDEIALSLIEMEKAQVYIQAKNYDAAYLILKGFEGAKYTMVNAQLHYYYGVLYNYYQAIGDQNAADEVHKIMEELPGEELG